LANRAGLALKLERALFEKGFEVLHLDNDESSSYALQNTIRAAERIGAVSIYSGRALDSETKRRLVRELNGRLLDPSGENEEAGDEEVFRRALTLADSLRLAKRQSNEGEAN
jgi:hypothetical protein